jgi:hypothetical protein
MAVFFARFRSLEYGVILFNSAQVDYSPLLSINALFSRRGVRKFPRLILFYPA